jgi:hypothetical protein
MEKSTAQADGEAGKDITELETFSLNIDAKPYGMIKRCNVSLKLPVLKVEQSEYWRQVVELPV